MSDNQTIDKQDTMLASVSLTHNTDQKQEIISNEIVKKFPFLFYKKTGWLFQKYELITTLFFEVDPLTNNVKFDIPKELNQSDIVIIRGQITQTKSFLNRFNELREITYNFYDTNKNYILNFFRF